MDAALADLCAAATGVPCVTFGLALSTLPEPHWSALSPARPLRRWDMVTFDPGPVLTRAPLQLAERVLNFVAGVGHLDARLDGPVRVHATTGELAPSHRLLADRLGDWLSEARAGGRWPAVVLHGADGRARRDLAAAACEPAGWVPHVLALDAIPADARDATRLRRLWEREAMLGAACACRAPADASRRSGLVRGGPAGTVAGGCARRTRAAAGGAAYGAANAIAC